VEVESTAGEEAVPSYEDAKLNCAPGATQSKEFAVRSPVYLWMRNPSNDQRDRD